MKKLVELSNDYIIEAQFNPTINENKEPLWADKEKGIAVGKFRVSGIEMMLPVYEKGYQTDKFQKIFIHVSDIDKLAEKIKEIESCASEDYCTSNLPF